MKTRVVRLADNARRRIIVGAEEEQLRSVARVIWTKQITKRRSGRMLLAAERLQKLDAEQEPEQLAMSTAEQGWWHATRLAWSGAGQTAQGVSKGTTVTARLTGNAMVAGAHLTGRAVKSSGAAVVRRVTPVVARTSNAIAVQVQAAARVAVVSLRAVAAALVASSAGLLPTIAAIISVVVLLVTVLPSWITGVGQQTEEEQQKKAVVVPLVKCAPRSYELGPVKSHVRAAAEHLGSVFGIETIGGWRPTDKIDPDGHPAGLAIDLMVPLTPEGKEQGQAIADYVQLYAVELNVKYVIWYQQIWSPLRAAEGWRTMEDRGSPTQNHHDHVHISFETNANETDLQEMLVKMCGVGSPTMNGWAAPLKNLRVSSPYGMRKHPVLGVSKMHTGVDYTGEGCGTPLYAVGGGTVEVRDSSGYGTLVTIQHGDGVSTRYAHMWRQDIQVATGDRVEPGQQIGKMGSSGMSTGCHLHFEVMVDGAFVDPQPFLRERGIG